MRRAVSPPAVPCAHRPQAVREMPSRSRPKRRDSGTRLRPRHDVAANSLERLCSRRRAASHARRVSAPTPDSMPHACAPLIRIPAPALLGRAGSHAGRRPARAATLFRVLRPMRSAREQREKLPSGDFHLHARLRFLPCRHARAACDSRGARHATGAGLKSLRSKT
jgi:hypothetical protein